MFTLGVACMPFDAVQKMSTTEMWIWRRLSASCMALAVAFALTAAVRFFGQQYALLHGSARFGGLDFYFIPIAVLVVEICVLVVALNY